MSIRWPLTFALVCQTIGGKKRLVFLDRNRYSTMIARLGDGEEVQATFSRKRDVKHNKKLHGVLSEVADALGWGADEFKEYIVTKLRPLEEDALTGFVRRQKTHTMSDDEIDTLVMEIKAWACQTMPGFVFQFDEQFKGV